MKDFISRVVIAVRTTRTDRTKQKLKFTTCGRHVLVANCTEGSYHHHSTVAI